MATSANTRAKGDPVDYQVPRYRLIECAYINDVMHEPGAEISWEGIPGWHMEPVNDAAIAMKEKHPSVKPDPIEEMTTLKAGDASLGDLASVFAKALQQAFAQNVAAVPTEA